jgi:hypothetical protein
MARNDNRDRMMRRERFLPLLLLGFALGHTSAAQSAEPVPTEDGKFHLIYLVSTDKVEVGAKAYVEPLFLTDGTDIKPVYEYCQALQSGISSPDQRLIADQERALERFCRNEAFTIDGRKLSARGAGGAALTLGKISFTRYATGDTTMVAPFMSNTGTAEVTSADKEPRVITPEQAEWRHFLMASNDKLLRSLIPDVTYQPTEYEHLLKRARAFAEREKGVRHAEGAIKERRRSKGFENAQVALVDTMAVDLDRNRQIDLVVGIRAPAGSDSGEFDFVWAAVGLIFRDGREELLSSVYQKTNYWHAVRAGAVPSAPLAVFQTVSCSFVVYRPHEFYGAIDFRAFGKPNDTCRDKHVMKVYEAAMRPH